MTYHFTGSRPPLSLDVGSRVKILSTYYMSIARGRDYDGFMTNTKP